MQQRNFSQHRHAFRATHVKTQGLVKGRLVVRSDLPEHLRQGMFVQPSREYGCVARFANESVFLQGDQEGGARGVAVRVFGVEGEMLKDEDEDDGEDDHDKKKNGQDSTTTTQDFFFNNAPMLELTDIATCLDIMQLREKYFDNPLLLAAQTRLRRDAIKQSAPARLPNTDMISMSFYTQSAFRFGEWYGHLGLFPIDEEMKRRTDKVGSGQSSEVLSEWLKGYFAEHGAKYELMIQLGTSPELHPTEDASVVWDESTAPYQTIATLEFPPQDSFNQHRRTFWEDRMFLSPWKGLAAHRPLGSINRLRRIVYQQSRQKRNELNACTLKDVQSIDEIP